MDNYEFNDDLITSLFSSKIGLFGGRYGVTYQNIASNTAKQREKW